jgi:RNA recognition motif-containing protein
MFISNLVVRSVSISSDIFTGKCRGFGTVAMEGHEARAAIAGLNGKTIGDQSLRVRFENPNMRRGRRRR